MSDGRPSSRSVLLPPSGGPAGSRFDGLIGSLLFLPSLSSERSKLVDAAIRVWSLPGFDTFASLPQLRFEPFDYQLRAAAAALRQMGGRAILADEVGLGKTIEAGIVLAELRARGLAHRALVLAPAGLVAQWGEELERKFGIPTRVAGRHRRDAGANAEMRPLLDEPVVLASLAAARRAPLLASLTEQDWDVAIVDEAHRVRNPRTASSKLVRSLRSRSLLLLTATPVENGVDDLHHLVSLVRPGHLGTLREFRRAHGGRDGAGARKLEAGAPAPVEARDIAGLRRELRSVMIRHRRSEVALMLPKRLAETRPVRPSEPEADLYREVADRVRAAGRVKGAGTAMALKTVLRVSGSTALAAAPTLERMGWTDLARRARALDRSAKVAALEAILRNYAATREKVIVVTCFKDSLNAIAESAVSLGIDAAVYHGSLSRQAKNDAVAHFERDVDVLLSTESVGEGRNLQFCHAMVNFDLPWNPMQIEQRLGRIHRIGQDHDVVLTNLVTRGTIEERILAVLHAKLNFFELVVGELDMVLGGVGEEFSFEDAVYEAHVESATDAELADRLERIGTALAEARTQYMGARHRTDDLVASMEGEDLDGEVPRGSGRPDGSHGGGALGGGALGGGAR